MKEIVVGKYTLESLSTGMYSDPRAIYREYIQNSTDSIDKAISEGILSEDNAEIHISISQKERRISIRDNGTGIAQQYVRNTLSDVGNSTKDYTKDRGFRGIGRLGGLAYCDNLYFITSVRGESVKTIMKWNCKRMKELVSPANHEISDIVGVIDAITEISTDNEDAELHYFEVIMENVISSADVLVDEEEIKTYLSLVAPVDFDSQKFRQAKKIKEFFAEKKQALPCYKVFFGDRRLPIYKLYTQRLDTRVGIKKAKETEYIRDIEFLYQEDDKGKPLYIGWLAITEFSGQINDEKLRGIRLRKNNILIGNEQSFSSYFPSEGHTANRMFAGEVHVLSTEIIPNSQRDDFEPSMALDNMKFLLSEWAGEINRKYRRGTSNATSAMRRIEEADKKQKELSEKVYKGAVTSETKREELTKELEKVKKQRKDNEKVLRRAVESGALDEIKKEKAVKLLEQSSAVEQEAATIGTQIVQSDYATKWDLPSSYSREVKKIYQRIIEVIDNYFVNDKETAEMLRKEIIKELSVKKK